MANVHLSLILLPGANILTRYQGNVEGMAASTILPRRYVIKAELSVAGQCARCGTVNINIESAIEG